MTPREYKEYLEGVSRYNSKGEKDASIILLEDCTPLEVARALNFTPQPKNDLEAQAMIFQSRKKSIGEGIEITVVCPECNNQDFYYIDIDNLFFKEGTNTLYTDVQIGLINDIEDLDDNFINNLSIDDFKDYEEKIILNNKKIFDPKVNLTCKKCGNVFGTILDYKGSISKFPIKNIYEQYLDLMTLGNMTKDDVDNMPSFEREIFIGIIQEREDKDKNKKQG